MALITRWTTYYSAYEQKEQATIDGYDMLRCFIQTSEDITDDFQVLLE